MFSGSGGEWRLCRVYKVVPLLIGFGSRGFMLTAH
nr:MAG TPA: hypothetical protein [Caudoviricetes sp.]